MSSTEKVSHPLVIRNDHYVFDKKLKTFPSGWISASENKDLSHPHITEFPSLKTFATLANVAYVDHKDIKSMSKVDGFTFLSAVNNSSTLNGYHGVAYVNKETKQVILSHRGTKISAIGPLLADLNGILRNKFVPQVTSAMTFAHKVLQYAEKLGYEVFFTGHSLGGWLAQITTFSTMYLTLDEVTGHFVSKPSPHTDVQMPYTVVFDSPGAYEFLFLLKKSLFPRHVESTQEIHVETLPVEVFLFTPNFVNSINFQIGMVFMLDVEKVGVDTRKSFGRGTHGMGPVVRLLSEMGEDQAVKWRVIDYRVGMKDMTSKSFDLKNRIIPWDNSSVPSYFFNTEERRFLEGAKKNFPPEGQFEGINWADEQISNDLMTFKDGGDLSWRLAEGDKSLVTCRDRREFIPRVRHIVRCFQLRGTLWWNPRKPQLPSNYINRRMRQAGQGNYPEKIFATSEIVETRETLALFVDTPGMGKSSFMTSLEMELRSMASASPRVIVRLDLNKVQETLRTHSEEVKGPSRFLELFTKYNPVTLLQETCAVQTDPLPIFVLLDGLDEVCPLYEQIMIRLLRSLLSEFPQSFFSVQKVILTTRPHLRTLIEDQFGVKAYSLLPLEFKEQTDFLQKQVSFDAVQSLISLPSTARSLMENPLMLSLYAQILTSHGMEGVVNLFDLYSQFMDAKHELHVVEKEEAEAAKQTTKQRVASILDDNLKYYFACAVSEMVGYVNTKPHSFDKEKILEQPSVRKLEELVSYGLLVSDEKGVGRFKHRSFAEFVYAKLLTNEEETTKELRDILFGKMYEQNVGDNVETFVQEILMNRQDEERRGSKSTSLRWLLTDDEAALYFGEERLECLVNGWLDSVDSTESAVQYFLKNSHSRRFKSTYSALNVTRLLKIRGGLVGVGDKTRAHERFYRGRLFPFLCGWRLLNSLDYSDLRIFRVIKHDTRDNGQFWRWLGGLGDHRRNWVRTNVFRMTEETGVEGEEHDFPEDVTKLILMIAVRTDDISKFLSHDEISRALNSLHFVVQKARKLKEAPVGRIRKTLEKYIRPQTLKHSLLLLLLGNLFNLETDDWRWDFECSWWYAEVFSSTELSTFFTNTATRVPNIPNLFWRAVKDVWGEQVVPRNIHRSKLTWPQYTMLSECQFVFGRFLWDEVERCGRKPDDDFIEAVREITFEEQSGWKVLEMLERRLVRQKHLKANSSSSPQMNILEQLVAPENVWTKLLETLQLHSQERERDSLWAWLPFAVRYSGNSEVIKQITQRLPLLTDSSGEGYFANAARSLILAHSLQTPDSSSVSKSIRSFIEDLKPDCLLNILLNADEDELGTLIKENSQGASTVTHTDIGGIFTCLLHKEKAKPNQTISNLSWELNKSPWDADSVAFMFTNLIKTSPCSELLGALKQFHASFPPDLLKTALLSQKVFAYLANPKCTFCFREYVLVDNETMCSLSAAFRYLFFVFGRDLRWIVQKADGLCLLPGMSVELLSALENETISEVFPRIETKLLLVHKIEEMLRESIAKEDRTLGWLARRIAYETEAEWERLLQALQLIPLKTLSTTRSVLVDHTHEYWDDTQSSLVLIRVWVKHFGVDETRRAADEQNLWKDLRESANFPRGEFLHAAVEVGSLEGVKTLAWPGLLKWKNLNGKTAGEVAVELYGNPHEISRFLGERFQAARVLRDDP